MLDANGEVKERGGLTPPSSLTPSLTLRWTVPLSRRSFIVMTPSLLRRPLSIHCFKRYRFRGVYVVENLHSCTSVCAAIIACMEIRRSLTIREADATKAVPCGASRVMEATFWSVSFDWCLPSLKANLHLPSCRELQLREKLRTLQHQQDTVARPFYKAHLFLPSALCGLCQRFYPCQNQYLCQAAFPALSSAKSAMGQETGVHSRVCRAAPFGWHLAWGPDYLETQILAAPLPTSASCPTAVPLIGSALLSCQAQLGRGRQSLSRIPASAPALPTAASSTFLSE